MSDVNDYIHRKRVLFENSFSVVRELFYCVDLFGLNRFNLKVEYLKFSLPAFENDNQTKKDIENSSTKDIRLMIFSGAVVCYSWGII